MESKRLTSFFMTLPYFSKGAAALGWVVGPVLPSYYRSGSGRVPCRSVEALSDDYYISLVARVSSESGDTTDPIMILEIVDPSGEEKPIRLSLENLQRLPTPEEAAAILVEISSQPAKWGQRGFIFLRPHTRFSPSPAETR